MQEKVIKSLPSKCYQQPCNYYYLISWLHWGSSITWGAIQKQIENCTPLKLLMAPRVSFVPRSVTTTSYKPPRGGPLLSQGPSCQLGAWTPMAKHVAILPNSRTAWRQGVNKVSLAPSSGAPRRKDGCDVKSRWLCRQGGGKLCSRWALQIQRSLSCKLPPMIFFLSLNYRERELEKTSDVWAVPSLNRIFSPFPM